MVGVAESKYELGISHYMRRSSATSLHRFRIYYKMYTNIIHYLIQQRQMVSCLKSFETGLRKFKKQRIKVYLILRIPTEIT